MVLVVSQPMVVPCKGPFDRRPDDGWLGLFTRDRSGSLSCAKGLNVTDRFIMHLPL